MSIVYIEREKCIGCYTCVHSCTAKAIKVIQRSPEVVIERCVNCGHCIQSCLTRAKQVESSIGQVWQLLEEGQPVIALLSASFPAAFTEVNPGQMVTALKLLGFSEVVENSFGAELVCREYARLIGENNGKSILASTCPAVVSYITKYYPQLIDNLTPIVSPMIATGRVIKKQYNPQAKVVFIGPCVAKKVEAKDVRIAGVVDEVLTFAELKEMFHTKGITHDTQKEEQFSGPKPNLGRLFALPGGLFKAVGLSDDILTNKIIYAYGRDYVPNIIQEFAEGNISARFINLYFCKGCIDGPVIDNDLSVFKRREIISNYTISHSDPAQTERDIQKLAGIDLSRQFTSQSLSLPTPSEEDIQRVLKMIDRTDSSYRMNCGACGYSSCRELAISVYQSLAEVDMCRPYMSEKLQSTQEELVQARKLTSLGQMAAAIAHEVNNPLSGVQIYTQLLTKQLTSGKWSQEVALDYLHKMNSELTRSTRLIRDILDFARQSPPTTKTVDINEIVDRALDLVTHSAVLQNIQIVKEFTPSLPVTTGDFDQLQQVFTDLILNAIQAMPQGGRLTLHTLVGDGNQLKVEIEDTGCGIPSENISKLGIPFFTTKRGGKGVGLGLAVVFGIIKQHQGRTEVQSKEGEGTTFTVYLPQYNEKET